MKAIPKYKDKSLSIEERRYYFLLDAITHFDETPPPRTYIKGCIIGRHLDYQLAKYLSNDLDNARPNDYDVFEALPEWMQELGSSFLYVCCIMGDGLHKIKTEDGYRIHWSHKLNSGFDNFGVDGRKLLRLTDKT